LKKYFPLLVIIFVTLLIEPSFSAEAEYKDSEPQNGDSGKGGIKKGVGAIFFQAFSSIVVSELGDKTFFIAAIMAMRYNRVAVLCGALAALFIMTFISVVFGYIVPTILPPAATHIVITILFFSFGFKLLWEAYHEEGGEENEEEKEVEIELNQLHNKLVQPTMPKHQEPTIEYNENEGLKSTQVDLEATRPEDCVKSIEKVASKLVFWQALSMTFLGEWGDRSQFTTIALAAEGGATTVFIGSFLGHVLCTSLAVMGGKFLAKKISERTVNLSGGILFVLFGVHNLVAK